MDLAGKRLTANRKVSPHNKTKILEFLDYLETQKISLPRRIRCLQNLTKLAAILQLLTDLDRRHKNDAGDTTRVGHQLNADNEIRKFCLTTDGNKLH